MNKTLRKLKDPTLDTLAIGAIASGIAVVQLSLVQADLVKGGALVLIGVALSLLKYFTRD